jgi:L-alanine-DL-glutamate epimerase-like enolase superfamily enzyme
MKLKKKYTLVTSLGATSDDFVQNVLIRINTDEGIYGYGESSPFPPITGSTTDTSIQASKYIAKLVIGEDPTCIEENMKKINKTFIHESSTRSAFDMAMFDILGKIAKLPVYKLLGGTNRMLKTDITIGHHETIEETLRYAKKHVESKFTELKIKTGRTGKTDYKHVKAIRDFVGEETTLKIDANQGWDYNSSLKNARMMESLNLLYFEQPLAAWNLDDMARLRTKINIPICADESVFNEFDAFKICKMGAADYLNIKLGKSGGIRTALSINAIAESYGSKCMIGCFGETRLGLTAATHLVLARPNIVFVDLDSALFLDDDPILEGMQYDNNVGELIHVPDKPGLGLELEEGYLNGWEKITIS